VVPKSPPAHRQPGRKLGHLPLEIGTGGTGLAHMPNLSKVMFRASTLSGPNPGLHGIDRTQLSNNGQVEATPSLPGPAYNSFNDCTWKTSCSQP
jgi:hypothetical protein